MTQEDICVATYEYNSHDSEDHDGSPLVYRIQRQFHRL